jgi:hypothetical protein
MSPAPWLDTQPIAWRLPATLSVRLKKFSELLFVLLGCLHLAGGPHSIVQIYAWTTMLVNYSQEDGLLQGVKDTFSGEKPCALCCKLKSSEKRETDHPVDVPTKLSIKPTEQLMRTTDVVVPSPTVGLLQTLSFIDSALSAGIHPDAPPVPPPCCVA